MKKKSKAVKKQHVSLKEQLTHAVKSTQAKLTGHGVFIMFVIAGAAIGFALYRSSTYLNPNRNENHYQEVSANNSYSKIDYTLVDKLQDALNDTDVTVNPELAPNRSNPFSE